MEVILMLCVIVGLSYSVGHIFLKKRKERKFPLYRNSVTIPCYNYGKAAFEKDFRYMLRLNIDDLPEKLTKEQEEQAKAALEAINIQLGGEKANYLMEQAGEVMEHKFKVEIQELLQVFVEYSSIYGGKSRELLKPLLEKYNLKFDTKKNKAVIGQSKTIAAQEEKLFFDLVEKLKEQKKSKKVKTSFEQFLSNIHEVAVSIGADLDAKKLSIDAFLRTVDVMNKRAEKNTQHG